MRDFQQAWCEDLLNKLLKRNISKIYFYDFSQTLSLPSDVIQPINLKEIQKKLINKNYTNISDFISDTKLLFEFSLKLFLYKSDMYDISSYLSDWWDKKCNDYPRSEQEKFILDLKNLENKIDRLRNEINSDTSKLKVDIVSEENSDKEDGLWENDEHSKNGQKKNTENVKVAQVKKGSKSKKASSSSDNESFSDF